MAKAKNGDKVQVHYTGKFDDGTEFDSSKGREPLEFVIGNNKVIPGFNDGVIGLEVGESKDIKISSENAYGNYREELIAIVEKNQFPADIDLQVGQQFNIGEQQLLVSITKIENNKVTIDGNHPMAGKDLNFEIKLVDII